MMAPDTLALYLASLGVVGIIGSLFMRSIERMDLVKKK